ncbi:dTDP-glucose 4,6-dehydratase [Blastopirellula sp. J2-11]|uniref:dTDP-glucose 4,6-dehydratase n=1 Tax=Blastopirellula sp. J2-11 TaxID=2943192 RepID=UPI0021C83BE6|nr:dTDP-glucose 4,6-dehydratase [Blastopirellula sp. J2-11]UUO04587.1 dTDP-glucose 4,6-dehydratase [Blastopirellula sp. J2-11]
MSKTVLVTGGAGFIGSCLVRQLVRQDNATVINLDKLTYAGNRDSLAELEEDARHILIEGDIGDANLVTRLLTEYQPSALLNLAAESHVDRSIDGPDEFVATNVLGTFTLLEAARRYWCELGAERAAEFRFLQVSTDEVYGSLGKTGLFTETSPYAPNSPYSASKASADHLVRAYFRTYAMPTLTTNCSNNYGPRQFPEKLIPVMILNALEGKPLPIYGDGQNVRDWLFVEDHCRALRRVLQLGRPGEVYHIGGNCERTNLEIVQAVCAAMDQLCPDLAHRPCEKLITFVQDRPGHDRRYAIDASKISSELQWSPQETFETGLEKTIQWYLANEIWLQRIAAQGYRRERLGLRADARSTDAQ